MEEHVSIATHHRKKLEVIMESVHINRIRAVLERHNNQAYTVVPCLSGRGARGDWTPDRLSESGSRVLLISVAEASIIMSILEDVFAVLETTPGVAFVSDVEVLRPERC